VLRKIHVNRVDLIFAAQYGRKWGAVRRKAGELWSFEWSRGVRSPLLAVLGNLPQPDSLNRVAFDPSHVVATCLKPADDPAVGGIVLRVWEVGGKSGPVALSVRGFRRAIQTDLLERNLKDLRMENGEFKLDLRGYGFAAVRLLD